MNAVDAARAWYAQYTLTQTWNQHLVNAGPKLGGVDYAIASGTVLPVVPGALKIVTPRTKNPPAWYNAGLGNAAYYQRDDGSATVMAHCSKLSNGRALSGNTGTSTGPHVHLMDIDTDGVTRRPPFTTIKTERHDMFRLIKTGSDRYDLFTPTATVVGITYAEALAYNEIGNIENSLDATDKKNASTVAAARKVWARIQEANLAALARPVDLDDLARRVAALVPQIDYQALAKAVNDDHAARLAD